MSDAAGRIKLFGRWSAINFSPGQKSSCRKWVEEDFNVFNLQLGWVIQERIFEKDSELFLTCPQGFLLLRDENLKTMLVFNEAVINNPGRVPSEMLGYSSKIPTRAKLESLFATCWTDFLKKHGGSPPLTARRYTSIGRHSSRGLRGRTKVDIRPVCPVSLP